MAFVRSVNLRFSLKKVSAAGNESVQQFNCRFGDASTVIKTELVPTRIVGMLE